jgi:hypothetical protein
MLSVDRQTTRVDLELANNNGVIVKTWNGRWEENSTPTTQKFMSGAVIYRLLMTLEDAGFTCEMCDANHGRALRGEITRIDIMQVSDKWIVKKYPYGWTGKTRPLSEKQLPDAEAEAAVQWCKKNGWTVREFPGGARAWKGEVKPVRDASTIMKMRRQVTANFQRGEIDSRRQFDLAFDC